MGVIGDVGVIGSVGVIGDIGGSGDMGECTVITGSGASGGVTKTSGAFAIFLSFTWVFSWRFVTLLLFPSLPWLEVEGVCKGGAGGVGGPVTEIKAG